MHHEFLPPPALRDLIRCFWYERRIADTQPEFEVVPDGYAEIIFHFGDLSSSINGALKSLPSPFMMGLLDKPAVFYSTGTLEIVAIRCYPWTVFDLLDLSSEKAGVQEFNHSIAGLHSTLQECIDAGKFEEAIAVVSDYFQTSLAKKADETLSKAGAAMRDGKGSLAIRDVAGAAHTTVRTLERKFRKSSGHTVKDVSGLIRFEQVRNRLWHQPESNLASLAAEFGYADQPHLSKEFKRYSRMTPAAFARDAKSKQAFFRDHFVAFVQA